MGHDRRARRQRSAAGLPAVPQGVSRPGAIRRATLYGSALGFYRLCDQRPAGGQRLFHARLDRLQEAGLLPDLRRDRPGAAERLRTPSAACWPAAGTTAPRIGSTTATGRGCWPNWKSSWPTARCKPSPPTARGGPPSDRTSSPASWPAKPTTPPRKSPAGPRPGRARAIGGRSAVSRLDAGQAPSVPERGRARDRRVEAGQDHRAEAGRVRVRSGPELRRLRAAEGPRAGRHAGRPPLRRNAQPRRHDLHGQSRRGLGHRHLRPQRRRRRDLAAAIHLPRLPLRRGDRLSGPADRRTPSPAWPSTRISP